MVFRIDATPQLDADGNSVFRVDTTRTDPKTDQRDDGEDRRDAAERVAEALGESSYEQAMYEADVRRVGRAEADRIRDRAGLAKAAGILNHEDAIRRDRADAEALRSDGESPLSAATAARHERAVGAWKDLSTRDRELLEHKARGGRRIR
jgi:hypothetical protein